MPSEAADSFVAEILRTTASDSLGALRETPFC
jgi:hypothetical protein